MFKSFFKSAPKPPKSISVIANYNSCHLGLKLASRFKENNNDALVLISPDDGKDSNTAENEGVLHFKAFLNEQEDISRFIGYMKENDMKISSMVYNQPYMLTKPP